MTDNCEEIKAKIQNAIQRYEERQRLPPRRKVWSKKVDGQTIKLKLLKGCKFIIESRWEREA